MQVKFNFANSQVVSLSEWWSSCNTSSLLHCLYPLPTNNKLTASDPGENHTSNFKLPPLELPLRFWALEHWCFSHSAPITLSESPREGQPSIPRCWTPDSLLLACINSRRAWGCSGLIEHYLLSLA